LDTTLFSPEHRDPAFGQKFGEHNGAVHLLYVGRISKEKDLDVLAQAYRQLRDEGLPIQLYLVGDGPYLQALNKALPEAVFTGYLRGKELAAAYASADVFVFPSTTDTFGNVVIEAQASGVPVIVSDTGGPKELVEANVNGVVTKSHDVEDLARAIRDLVDDKRKRDQMSRRAGPAVRARTWSGAGRKIRVGTRN